MNGRFLRLCVVPALTVLPACTVGLPTPELGAIYTRAAREHSVGRNPVIVIPGILGTRLIDSASGQVVWGAFGGDSASPANPDGARLLALPMRAGAALDGLLDGVAPDGVLDRARITLLGLPIELNAYANILATLGAGGYRDRMLAEAGAVDYGDDHFTCFQFAYDWRRDNVENAARLGEFIEQQRAFVQRKLRERHGPGDYDVKFDIVAHSMGGLIARYYVMYGDADLPQGGSPPPITWAGARHVERVILVGTPNTGSVKSLLQLVDGARFGPFLPPYEPAILGTMPSVYQLLPRPRHGACVTRAGERVDFYDPAVWQRYGWGLADPRQEGALSWLLPDVADAASRRKVALDHLRKSLDRARRFQAALDQPAAVPAGLELHLFAGDAVETAAVVEVGEEGRLRVRETGPGDATVLRASTLCDERVDADWQPRLRSPVRWTSTHFLASDHLGMTRDPAFSNNVLHLLLEAPR